MDAVIKKHHSATCQFASVTLKLDIAKPKKRKITFHLPNKTNGTVRIKSNKNRCRFWLLAAIPE